MLTYIVSFFTYFPYVVFALTMTTFVLRLRLGVRGKAIWAMVLLACCSKFLCFRELGGHVFTPELPAEVIWTWNWAYSGAMILSVLSLVAFFRFRGRGIVLPVVAWALSLWGVYNGVVPPVVKEFELHFDGLPAELDGYRIVQISDLHASSAARAWRTEKVVEIANALSPDLVCLTGDYVDGRIAAVRGYLAPIANLRAKDGVWAVTGNHEWFGEVGEWRRWYDLWGIRFLANECVFPRRGLALGGVDDFRAGAKGAFPDVGETFAAATNGEFRILLQHQPRTAHANIEGHGVRLQLSGHTHGGIMPGFRPIVRSHNGGFVRGLYEFPHGVLYVNSGCGQWAGFPIRFFTPSEVTLVTLRSTAAAQAAEAVGGDAGGGDVPDQA